MTRMELNVNDIMHITLFPEANMVEAVEANLYCLISKTVSGGSGQIFKSVLFKRRIMNDYNKTL